MHMVLGMGDETSKVVCLICFAEGERHAAGGRVEGEIDDWFVFATQILFWFLVTEAAKGL